MNRRGQGLSVNMIILMALGLIVLIVLVVMFMRSSGNTNKVISSCETLGGDCDQATCAGTSKPYPVGSCENKNPCCLLDTSVPAGTAAP